MQILGGAVGVAIDTSLLNSTAMLALANTYLSIVFFKISPQWLHCLRTTKSWFEERSLGETRNDWP